MYLFKILIKCLAKFFVSIVFLFPSYIYTQNDSEPNDHIFNIAQLQGEKVFYTKHRLVQNIVLGDIYYMDPNGSNVQQLTNFSDELFVTERPEISSDGSKLVFCSNYNSWKSTNYVDAFILDFATGSVKRVTGYEKTNPTTATGTVNVTVTYPQDYVISPSAIRISYSGCNNFVTGNSATLTVPADEEIWIKAEVSRGKGDIEVVNVPSGGNKSIQLNLMDGTLTAESCSPSPNGNFVAVSRNSETISQQGEAFPWYKILIWDIISSIPNTEAGGLKLGGDKHPAFSPDGTLLAVCTGELFSNSLAVLSTSNITANPKILVEGKRFFNQEFCSDPAWSPSSQEIVFAYTILNAVGELESNLYKIPSSGGTPLKLTFHSGNEIVSRPSYSPDGTKIAYSRLKSKSNTFTIFDLTFYNFSIDIYVIPSNGGSPFPITNDGNAIDPSWGVVNATVGFEEQNNKRQNEFDLIQNYPNPFNSSTTIKYTIPTSSAILSAPNSRPGFFTENLQDFSSQSSKTTAPQNDNVNVTLKIYDILGEEVTTLVNKNRKPGNYTIEWNATNQSSGTYFYQIITSDFIQTKKMILLK